MFSYLSFPFFFFPSFSFSPFLFHFSSSLILLPVFHTNSETKLLFETKRHSSVAGSEKKSLSHEPNRTSQVIEVAVVPQHVVAEREMDHFLKVASETGRE